MRKDSGDRPRLQKQPSAERRETDPPPTPEEDKHSFNEIKEKHRKCSSIHKLSPHHITTGRCRLTVNDGSTGDFPEDHAESPDVGLLVGLKHVGADGLVQHLGCHVAFGPHTRVVAHVKVVPGLRVYDSQSWREEITTDES